VPEKLSDIPDQSRGYFGRGYDTITLDVSEYVNANGSELTYVATSSNTDFAEVTVNGSILSIKISGATGSSDITLDVFVGEEKYLMYEFSVTPKTYTKIACVGDSLTASSPCYPTYLQQILGSDIEVGNFGRSGASLSQYTNNDSYGAYNSVWNQTIYAEGVEFAKDADLVIIMLGTNDATKIENGQPKFDWETVKPAYKAAYEALINDYKAVNPDIEVVMMTSPPVLSENTLSISNEILDTKTYALQLEIAEELGIKLLDFRAYLKGLSGGYDDYYRDGVHFNEAGAQLFAEFVAKGI
jgi:sialate O-acetylesterase